MDQKIFDDINSYYTEKIRLFGNTSLGVDWNSKESQYLRFEQVCKLITIEGDFSLIDYGCGYGELVNYLDEIGRKTSYSYTGYDLSEIMIKNAKSLFVDHSNVEFHQTLPGRSWDYLISSGIFNVKPENVDDEKWLDYILNLLKLFYKSVTRGFSCNLLTTHSDRHKRESHLFYADPLYFFDYCKKNISRNVALLHDYDLYEFTLIVRK